jgi:uncharacterized protein YaeQ
VIVYAYGSAADVWWRGIEGKLARLERLQVWRFPTADAQALAGLAERSMQLQATVQEGVLTLSSARVSVAIEPVALKAARH